MGSDIISTKGSAFPRIIIKWDNILTCELLGGISETNARTGLDITRAGFRPFFSIKVKPEAPLIMLTSATQGSCHPRYLAYSVEKAMAE